MWSLKGVSFVGHELEGCEINFEFFQFFLGIHSLFIKKFFKNSLLNLNSLRSRLELQVSNFALKSISTLKLNPFSNLAPQRTNYRTFLLFKIKKSPIIRSTSSWKWTHNENFAFTAKSSFSRSVTLILQNCFQQFYSHFLHVLKGKLCI